MKYIIVLTCLMLASSVALAEAPSYSYVELGYSGINIEDTDTVEEYGINDFTVRAWTLSASSAVSDHIRVFGSYSRGVSKESENFTTDRYVERTNYEDTGEFMTVGFGYYGLINENTTWDINVGYIDTDCDRKMTDTGRYADEEDYDYYEKWEWSDDNNGLILGVGLRSNISDNLELNGALVVTNVDGERRESIEIGTLLTIHNGIGITASLTAGSDYAAVGAGIRYTF